MTYFYNTVTGAVISYTQLKSLYPMFEWPNTDNGASVDARLLMDNLHPDIVQYKRLFLVTKPEAEKIWEIVDDYTVIFNSTENRYEQSWNIRPRTEPEMVEVNVMVQNHLEELRLQELLVEVEYDGLFADSRPETQVALSRVLNSILSNMTIEEIAWEGNPDENNLNRWKLATVEGLQTVINITFDVEQKSYKAKKHVMDVQKDNSYDTLDDVTNAFVEQMMGS